MASTREYLDQKKIKDVISGRKLVESDIPHWLVDYLKAQGWMFSLTRDAPIHKHLVLSFYKNLSWERGINGKVQIETEVCNVKMVISDELLGSLFKLSLDGLDIYTKNEWIVNDSFDVVDCLSFLNDGHYDSTLSSAGSLDRPLKTALKGDWAVLAKLIRDNLVPTKNRDKSLSIMECQLMYFILKGMKVNLPAIIIQHMIASKDKQNLPYGLALTIIFHKFKRCPKPPKNLAPLLDEKAMLHHKVYFLDGTYYNSVEFSDLSLELQNLYRQLHNQPPLSKQPTLKRARTVGDSSSAPSEEEVDKFEELFVKIKQYMNHKLIRPMKKQLGKMTKAIVELQKLHDRERTPSYPRPSQPKDKGKGKAIASQSDSEEDWENFMPLLEPSKGIRIEEPREVSDSDSNNGPTDD